MHMKNQARYTDVLRIFGILNRENQRESQARTDVLYLHEPQIEDAVEGRSLIEWREGRNKKQALKVTRKNTILKYRGLEICNTAVHLCNIIKETNLYGRNGKSKKLKKV
jgi:hypothetical protein